MHTYQEDWDVYMCLVDSDHGEVACSIFMDLGRIRVAPMPSHPVRVKVSLAVHQRRENGMPTREDLNAIQELEELVIQAAEPRGAIFVGAATTGERRRSTFYVPDHASITEALLAAIPADRRDAVFVEVEDDPGWAYYREFLFPSPPQLRFMMDERVLRANEEAGDIASIPRRNDHWAYFDDAPSRDSFLRWVEEHGYEVERLIEPGEEQERFGVQFHHTSDLLPRTIHPAIEAIRVAAEEAGGEYDGWETFVVRAEAGKTGHET